VSILRIEDADGKTRTYAERDVVRATLPQEQDSELQDMGVAKVITTLYTVDGDTPTRVENDVATSSDVGPQGAQVAQNALRILNGSGGTSGSGASFGNPGLCKACNTAIQIIQVGNTKGVNTLISGAMGALLAHHTFSIACLGVGAAIAVTESAADTAAEVGSAGVATPAVVAAAPAEAAAAVGGYQGCRYVMAAVAVWAAARAILPTDAAGRVDWCNSLADSLPGKGHWCVQSGPPSCELSAIPQSGDPQAQCVAVGACARDTKCPESGTLCAELFVASSPDAQAARERCQKIVPVACGPAIQSPADLSTACQAVLQ
jgi:hypothetical protein